MDLGIHVYRFVVLQVWLVAPLLHSLYSGGHQFLRAGKCSHVPKLSIFGNCGAQHDRALDVRLSGGCRILGPNAVDQFASGHLARGSLALSLGGRETALITTSTRRGC